ncbi:hypothetical protein P7C70_g441, partial [Phenoliferia sp. Uapishka_3]
MSYLTPPIHLLPEYDPKSSKVAQLRNILLQHDALLAEVLAVQPSEVGILDGESEQGSSLHELDTGPESEADDELAVRKGPGKKNLAIPKVKVRSRKSVLVKAKAQQEDNDDDVFMNDDAPEVPKSKVRKQVVKSIADVNKEMSTAGIMLSSQKRRLPSAGPEEHKRVKADPSSSEKIHDRRRSLMYESGGESGFSDFNPFQSGNETSPDSKPRRRKSSVGPTRHEGTSSATAGPAGPKSRKSMPATVGAWANDEAPIASSSHTRQIFPRPPISETPVPQLQQPRSTGTPIGVKFMAPVEKLRKSPPEVQKMQREYARMEKERQREQDVEREREQMDREREERERQDEASERLQKLERKQAQVLARSRERELYEAAERQTRQELYAPDHPSDDEEVPEPDCGSDVEMEMAANMESEYEGEIELEPRHKVHAPPLIWSTSRALHVVDRTPLESPQRRQTPTSKQQIPISTRKSSELPSSSRKTSSVALRQVEPKSLPTTMSNRKVTPTTYEARPLASIRFRLFIAIPLLVVLLLTWREEKVLSGFCDTGSDTNALVSSRTFSLALPSLPHFLRSRLPPIPNFIQSAIRKSHLVPSCTACPAHGNCRDGAFVSCASEYVSTAHPFAFGGLIPLSPRCKADTKKQMIVAEVASRLAKKLRQRRGEVVCKRGVEKMRWMEARAMEGDGEAAWVYGLQSEALEMELKEENEAVGSPHNNDFLEDVFRLAIADLVTHEEVITREASIEDRANWRKPEEGAELRKERLDIQTVRR